VKREKAGQVARALLASWRPLPAAVAFPSDAEDADVRKRLEKDERIRAQRPRRQRLPEPAPRSIRSAGDGLEDGLFSNWPQPGRHLATRPSSWPAAADSSGSSRGFGVAPACKSACGTTRKAAAS
jgi:hypothetical protein